MDVVSRRSTSWEESFGIQVELHDQIQFGRIYLMAQGTIGDPWQYIGKEH